MKSGQFDYVEVKLNLNLKHFDTEDNNSYTPFDFSPKMYEQVNFILSKYPKNKKKSAILPLLDLAQIQSNG
jgi:NADH dehydrogenase (ubiquinone) flavoprotein 2